MNEPRRHCTIELTAEGHAGPCPEECCVYWENGCILGAVQSDLTEQPEVAELLLRLRRELEAAEREHGERTLEHFHRRLAAGRE